MSTSLAEMAFNVSPQAQVMIDPYDNKILTANQQACEFLKLDTAHVNQQLFSHYFIKQLPQWLVFTEQVLNQGEAWTDDLIFTLDPETDRSSQSIKIEMIARMVFLDSRPALLLNFQNAETLSLYRERSNAQRDYQSGIGHWNRISTIFQEFERHNHLILEAAGEGIYGVDEQGNTTFFNDAAERMLGWQACDVLGKNIHDLIHHSHKDGCHYDVKDCPIYKAFRDGKQRQVDDEIFWTKRGTAIDVEYTSTPMKDNGHLVGAVVIFRDVTQRRLDQKRLIDALNEVEHLKNRLEQENAYLQEEINSGYNHHQIVGKSYAIQTVIQQIEMVAPTDATVLITGESGTGKELIARALHESSLRRERPLIRVNCAAIPADLFESEFFGHRKGAFTGATDSRLGRFEIADGGTLFLDEVGEIPLSLQGKLLRVLQEQQFERVGESTTRTVDVRIITATNQNLQTLVSQGRFREDLYFRLNVFPVQSVPLRERREDIPLLAKHFLDRMMAKANKPGLKISLHQLEYLKRYSWPGNIRELENVIERQVILARGKNLIFSDLPSTSTETQALALNTLKPEQDLRVLTENEVKDQEKKNIVSALKQSRGKVSGEGGAAEILGVKPTTLSSRIKKYGINPKKLEE